MITNTLMWEWQIQLCLLMQRMSPRWPSHQNSCLGLARYHPVATIIPHGCCSLDYHGDNPEVKGSVPWVGPPTLQAGSTGTTLLPLRRLLFTLCHSEVAKWVKQNANINERKKLAIISPVTSFLGGKIIGNLSRRSRWQCSYNYWLNAGGMENI